MLSVDTGVNTQAAQIAQTPSSPLGPTAANEEKRKQSHIPTVEVSAAQAQGFSARVGEFLSNQPSKQASVSSGSTAALGATGADGIAPPVAVPVAIPPAAASNNDGSSTDRETGPNQNAFAQASAELELDGAARAETSDRSRDDDEGLEFHEDGTYSASQQALRYVHEELPPIVPAAAGTVVNINQQADAAAEAAEEDSAFAEDQRREEEEDAVEEAEEARSKPRSEPAETKPNVTTVANGNFKLQFDDAGTYGFAAA